MSRASLRGGQAGGTALRGRYLGVVGTGSARGTGQGQALSAPTALSVVAHPNARNGLPRTGVSRFDAGRDRLTKPLSLPVRLLPQNTYP